MLSTALEIQSSLSLSSLSLSREENFARETGFEIERCYEKFHAGKILSFACSFRKGSIDFEVVNLLSLAGQSKIDPVVTNGSVLISSYLRCSVVSVRATFLGRIMDNRRPPVPVVISRGVINEASLTCGLRQRVKAPVETMYTDFNGVSWLPANSLSKLTEIY